VTIGDYVNFSSDVFISVTTGASLSIGRDSLVGPGTKFHTTNHAFDDLRRPIREQGDRPGPNQIVVGEDVWIGSNCVILSGVVIGSHTVIGAGSIVTASIPPWVVAAGNPCRVLKSRRTEGTDP